MIETALLTYDPFVAGPFPVAGCSSHVIDRARGHRDLAFAVWFPVAAASISPLVLYSHASYGHARQSAFLATHLASHGYTVAAADHTGNTAADFAERARRLAAGDIRPRTPEEAEEYLRRIIADRVPDLRALLDHVLSGALSEIPGRLDSSRIGVVGWSFGGWAVLATPEVDERIRAVVALAPAGSSKPLPGIIPATLTFDWKHDVPTLFLVAERDRFTPLPGQYELLERTRSRKRMFVLRGADHEHFGDRIDEPGACPPEHAHLFARGLTLAHFDAFLKGDESARAFLSGDPVAALRERGVDAAYPEPAG
jgi:predicted dienelactone hydrolase